MSNFINNLLSRHLDSSNTVLPRLPGRFEYAGPSLLPVDDIEVINQKNEVPDSVFEPDAGKNISEVKTRIPDEEEKIDKSRYIPPQKPVNEPLVVIDKDTKDNNKSYSSKVEHKASIDNNEKKPVNVQIVTPEKYEEKVIKRSKTSHVSNHNKDESETNELSVPSSSPLPETPNIKGNLEKFQKKQFDNLELSSKEHPPELHNNNIKPKQSNIKYGENVDQVHNINQFHYINTEFHNHHIVPVEKAERIFEYKPTAESQPTIKVNIGRIEVRAIIEPVQTQPQRKVSLKPKLSLDDYLKQRDGGSQ